MTLKFTKPFPSCRRRTSYCLASLRLTSKSDHCIRSSKGEFKERALPLFNKNNSALVEEPGQRLHSAVEQQGPDEGCTLLEYYEENKQALVYKRFD